MSELDTTENKGVRVLRFYGKSPSIQIIAPRPDPSREIREIQEHDRILMRLLAQRAPEWQRQRGIGRVITRLKIELWAWRETARQQRKRDRRDLLE